MGLNPDACLDAHLDQWNAEVNCRGALLSCTLSTLLLEAYIVHIGRMPLVYPVTPSDAVVCWQKDAVELATPVYSLQFLCDVQRYHHLLSFARSISQQIQLKFLISSRLGIQREVIRIPAQQSSASHDSAVSRWTVIVIQNTWIWIDSVNGRRRRGAVGCCWPDRGRPSPSSPPGMRRTPARVRGVMTGAYASMFGEWCMLGWDISSVRRGLLKGHFHAHLNVVIKSNYHPLFHCQKNTLLFHSMNTFLKPFSQPRSDTLMANLLQILAIQTKALAVSETLYLLRTTLSPQIHSRIAGSDRKQSLRPERKPEEF
jgi:hypothetical protein